METGKLAATAAAAAVGHVFDDGVSTRLDAANSAVPYVVTAQIPNLKTNLTAATVESISTTSGAANKLLLQWLTTSSHTTEWGTSDANNLSQYNTTMLEDSDLFQSTPITVLKGVAIVLIMVIAAFGNLLVIVSILRTPRLRIIANSFLVSLAFADLLVAMSVMPFNASKELAGKNLYSPHICSIY